MSKTGERHEHDINGTFYLAEFLFSFLLLLFVAVVVIIRSIWFLLTACLSCALAYPFPVVILLFQVLLGLVVSTINTPTDRRLRPYIVRNVILMRECTSKSIMTHNNKRQQWIPRDTLLLSTAGRTGKECNHKKEKKIGSIMY